MFFSLSPTADDRFPNRSSIPGGFFNHDNGWQWQQMSGQTVAFKGYTETAIDKLVQDPTPRHKGNFCLIIPGNQKTIVTHDINRSFPLFWYHDQQILTNLQLDNSHTAVYADRYVSLDSSLTYHQTFFNCYGNVDQLPITVEDCVDQLGCLLEQKIQNLKLDLPIKLFLSGGLDTGLLGALANKSKIDYERIHYEHFDYDQFTYKNITNIKKKYWPIHKYTIGINPVSYSAGHVEMNFFYVVLLLLHCGWPGTILTSIILPVCRLMHTIIIIFPNLTIKRYFNPAGNRD
jgi:hypothetical protein